MESDESLGSVSGLIYFGDGQTIYSAGGWVNEMWIASGLCHKSRRDACVGIDKDGCVSYADGAYMVARVDAIKRSVPHGKPFIDDAFLYFGDYLLSLTLWNRGYRVKYIPVECGLHYHGKTIGKLHEYYGYRAHIALSRVVNTQYSGSLINNVLILERKTYRVFNRSRYRAFIEGIKLSEETLLLLGKPLNLYCAPYIRVSRFEALKYLSPVKLWRKESEEYLCR